MRADSSDQSGVSESDTAVLLADDDTHQSDEASLGHAFADDAMSRSIRQERGQRKRNLGRYQISRELGSGAFGVVYLARDPELSRDVAVKLPRFSKETKSADRFRKEARAVARLRHPNIVSVFDHGETTDGVFIVYEYVPGETLERTIEQGELDLPTTIEWVATLADALHYAATEGIVHRDMKPGNVMIDSRGRPQIMDFGLAEALLGGKAATGGRIAGTPAYMSPEQARGETHVGPASDQYALGAMLYEMITGERAVTTRGKAAIIEIAERQSPPIGPLAQISRDLRAICLKAMSADAEDRYEDCGKFAADLRRFRQGFPVVARPISPVIRLWKWSRRNVGTAVSAAAAAMLLILVATVSSVAALVLQQKRSELSAALADAEIARLDAEKNAEEATRQRREAERQAGRAVENELAEVVTKIRARPGLTFGRIAAFRIAPAFDIRCWNACDRCCSKQSIQQAVGHLATCFCIRLFRARS